MTSRSAEFRNRPLVFVDDLADPELDDADFHHFDRVLRIGRGDPIVLGDGAGGYRTARFEHRPVPEGEIGHVERPDPPLAIAFSPVKGERPEFFVQKLTELGVDEIIPIRCERTVVRWDGAKAAKNHDRLVKVAREACLQARRLHLPTIGPLTSLDAFLARFPGAVLADPEGRPMTGADRALAVGPEGGFSDAERISAASVALPGNILRAETAAVTAAAIACGLRSGLVGPL